MLDIETIAAEAHRPAPHDTLVSVVLPVFNEVGVLEPLFEQVRQALANCRVR